MESVLLLKMDWFESLYHKGFVGWMEMAQHFGLLYHFILILMGLLVCYYGFRIYKTIVITMGALAGGLGGLLLIDALHLSGAGVNIDPLVQPLHYGIWDYFGFVIGAFIGGAVFWWLSWLAIFALGFIGCCFIGFFAVSSFAPGQLAIFVGVGLGVVGGVLAVYLFKPFLIIVTAILGAFDFAVGVASILVATGVITVLTGDESAGMWAFIFPFVLMIILGIVNQVLDNYRKDYINEAVPKAAEPPEPNEKPAPAT